MNILHVIDQLSLTHGGGAAMVTYQLAEAQARLGHNVTIATTDWHMNGQKPPEGVKVKAYHYNFSPFGLRVSLGMMSALLPRKHIVHLHNYRTFANWCYGGAATVLEAHGSMPTSKPWLDTLAWKPSVFSNAKRYIANSELEIPQYEAQGAKRKEIAVIPPGIDWREFETLPQRNTKPYKTVLYLGRIHPVK